jgi:hypothetical protein
MSYPGDDRYVQEASARRRMGPASADMSALAAAAGNMGKGPQPVAPKVPPLAWPVEPSNPDFYGR